MPAKDFEYLLGMPMWSVTEERVNQLVKQMNEKKTEHDALNVKHIHALWTEDLDAFMLELKKIWTKEEEERERLGGVKTGGKSKRAAPAKKGKKKPA